MPLGLYPRLILMHFTVNALREHERTFYVGKSANCFLALMGTANNGSVNGGLTRTREQLRQLSLTACSYHDRTQDRGQNIVFADKQVTWLGRAVRVTLVERSYRISKSASVPLDAGVLFGSECKHLRQFCWKFQRVLEAIKE